MNSESVTPDLTRFTGIGGADKTAVRIGLWAES
jgi:hypothetical protein